jgi:hypothetical protein
MDTNRIERFSKHPVRADVSPVERDRIDAQRLTRFSRVADRKSQSSVTPRQGLSREKARLNALERRRGQA